MALPLLLLPGMMCDARLFGPQIAALHETREVIVPELKADNIAAMAEAVLAEAPAQFAVAGLSMGGMVALHMAAQAPDRVARLALLGTTARADLPHHSDRRAALMDRVRQGALEAVLRDDLLPYYTAKGPRQAETLARCAQMAHDLGPQRFIAHGTALDARPDVSDTLPNLKQPTLVLCGDQDRMCPLSQHQEMAAMIPEAALVVLEGVGHISTLEDPDAVTGALTTWLDGC